MPCSSLNSHI